MRTFCHFRSSTFTSSRRSSLGSCTRAESATASCEIKLRALPRAASCACVRDCRNDGPAMRHKYFTESRNSLAETVGAMDLAAAIGAVRQSDADDVQALAARLRRMLTALLR
jgi:hypothetical protein